MSEQTVVIGDATYERPIRDENGKWVAHVSDADDERGFFSYYVPAEVHAAFAEIDIFGKQLTDADV